MGKFKLVGGSCENSNDLSYWVLCLLGWTAQLISRLEIRIPLQPLQINRGDLWPFLFSAGVMVIRLGVLLVNGINIKNEVFNTVMIDLQLSLPNF